MQNFNDLFAYEYHKSLFVKFHEFYGNILCSFIPAFENLVPFKIRPPKFFNLLDMLDILVDTLMYSDHDKFYTLNEFLIDCENGLLDLRPSTINITRGN